MHQDEEIHAELMAKFREYFAANQEWMAKGTHVGAIRVRRILSEIRKICSRRRVVLREWQDVKEIELAEKEAERQAQKRQAQKDDNAN